MAGRKKEDQEPNTAEWQAVFARLRMGPTEFARIAGLTPSNFFHIAKGHTRPTVETQRKIDAVLEQTCPHCGQYLEVGRERVAGKRGKAAK